ncbi:hypothetical protein BJK06_15030 [Curtobacterium sp. BH-2-1-1]|uniref:hypothetical protein n=1 Tax=Curtobacterium sp. BH-2-1-1 TaxID=1905847 RepID=UPI00089DF768|nr:hypothetical protein [Curtobacterium sp. BH-2-1-1]AOX66858.1 hypothetical protein BJK06_15030 [Curtobacterium sp. BH-2-1-1]
MTFRSPAPRSIVFSVLSFCAPIVVAATAGAAVTGFDGTSIVVLVLLVGGVGVAICGARRTAAFVSVSEHDVTLGLAPFWWTRLPLRAVRGVTLVNVDACAAWAGIGIKGRQRTRPGRLYSVGGAHGVAIIMDDGRRVTVAFPRRETALRVVEAIDAMRSAVRLQS